MSWAEMRPKTTLFYDVDTQHDFLHPSGALYVVDGERILPVLADLTQFARDSAIRIVAQVDRHFPEDPELERNGGPYPDHCMDGTHGHPKVSETLPAAPLHVEGHQLTDEEIAAALEWQG